MAGGCSWGRAVKQTACECRLNNIVLNNPVGFWSAPVGLLLELGWVLACG